MNDNLIGFVTVVAGLTLIVVVGIVASCERDVGLRIIAVEKAKLSINQSR